MTRFETTAHNAVAIETTDEKDQMTLLDVSWLNPAPRLLLTRLLPEGAKPRKHSLINSSYEKPL